MCCISTGCCRFLVTRWMTSVCFGFSPASSSPMALPGVAGFFRPPVPQRGHKLTPQRLQEVQEMLDAGMEVPLIGSELGVLPNTIHKAIRAGRLKKKSPVGLSTPLAAANAPEPSSASTQGTRSVADGEAVMGGGNHPLHGTGGHRSRRFGASRNAF